MPFIHDDREFNDLVQIVAGANELAPALVEKDYWVTHVLWSIATLGLEVWLKGGTSLSKGFGLITRFSEDLDLKLESGTVTQLASVKNWKSRGAQATSNRKNHFEALTETLVVPGAELVLEDGDHIQWRSVNVRVEYPGVHLGELDPLRPFVLLEIGSARVTPFVERPISSFVHDYLEANAQLGSYDENRPGNVRCLHPLVTLIEKLDALQHRALDTQRDPSAFVRHYEDVAQIISYADQLPKLEDYVDIAALIHDLDSKNDIRHLPDSTHGAFAPSNTDPRWDAIRLAHDEITPMFWGPRISLDESCLRIREWLHQELDG